MTKFIELDYNGLMPWWGSRASLMKYYRPLWPKKCDVAFDLFGGGGSALPYLCQIASKVYFSDLCQTNTRTLLLLKEEGGYDRIIANITSLANVLDQMGPQDRRDYCRRLYIALEEPIYAGFEQDFLAAAPLLLGRVLHGGSLGKRWFPSLRPLGDQDLRQALDVAVHRLDRFIREVDLDRIEVLREDYRNVLGFAKNALSDGKKVFVWADLPFPMESRGTKDNRSKDPARSMPRAQYLHDMDSTEHSEFFRNISPLLKQGGFGITIPTYINDLYDELCPDWAKWGRVFLADRVRGFLPWQDYCFVEDPKEPIRKVYADKPSVTQKVEFTREAAIEYAGSISTSSVYQDYIADRLRDVPVLSRAEATSKRKKIITSRSSLWRRAKETVYYHNTHPL